MIKIVSKIILLFIIYLLSEKLVIAISTPSLISPLNNSTTGSSSLSWQSIDGATQYKVIVDDEPDITSPYIKGPYYTTNTKYSPTLSEGKYYWKVTAKDSAGNWSDWSGTWNFTLSATASDPTPPASSTTNPDSNPTSSPKANFTISSVPAQINSDQSFNIQVSLSLPSNPSSIFYLKGAFKTEDGSNYFGQTKVGSTWIKNGSSYSSQYKITTDSSGNWSGYIEVKPDADDSGFTGTDNYIFKVARYNSSGSGPNWSNETTTKIAGVQISSSNPNIPTTQTKTATSPDIRGVSKSLTPNQSTSSSKSAMIPSSSSAIIKSTNEPAPQSSIVKAKQNLNLIPIIAGGILIILGGGYIFYIKLRKE